MKAFQIAIKELFFRWRSSLMMVLVVATITGLVSFFWVNRGAFTREIKRNVRDIGSNVVILPIQVDQVAYHDRGGYSEQTMPYRVVEQLIEFKASLNHLIPMLEQRALVKYRNQSESIRVVGIAASIPMPGRPKAPMQRAVKPNSVQIGSALAEQLGIDPKAIPSIDVAGKELAISRVNQPTGTWQDTALFVDLDTAQEIFEKPSRISRIEAIECTSEKCIELGVSSNVVLTNELANITDQAQILRRRSMADARANVRNMSRENLDLLTNAMWIFLVASTIFLATWNASQRKSEIGVFRAIGFTRPRILGILLWRATLLAALGALAGVAIGSGLSFWQATSVFEVTGSKATIDLLGIIKVALTAVILAALATLIPAVIASSRHPAEIIGKDAT